MALFHGQLDVLRIVVGASDDDQVLEPACDEEFAILLKTEIAGAQKGKTLTRGGKVRPKSLLGLLGLIPIASGDARPGNPNFANLAGRALTSRFGIDDRDLLTC